MTDEQKEILGKHENRILNFAHVKDGWCYIYGDDGEEIDLNEFLAKHCPMGCDVELFREQGCSECASCPLSALEVAAIQAAELRERLSRAVEFPCKIGDKIYIINTKDRKKQQWKVCQCVVNVVALAKIRNDLPLVFRVRVKYKNGREYTIGRNAFLTKEAAEARLKELEADDEKSAYIRPPEVV